MGRIHSSFPVALTFDDVLIKPVRSTIEPREASLRAVLSSTLTLQVPFLSAAMDRVTEEGLAIALARAGGLGILHRNCSIEAQVEMVQKGKQAGLTIGAACGPFDTVRADALLTSGVDALVIDCAHGHNGKVITSARAIKKRMKQGTLIVGNVATAEAVRDLRGVADVVKVGVGPGSICTTRLVSGVGVPQFTAIMDVATEAHRHGMRVIADGGMRSSGDIAKALAAGADAVMLGSIFAGTDEAPGKVVTKNGVRMKEYRGMGSEEVLRERQSSDRYLVEGRKAVAEGVSGWVKTKGPLADVVAELSSGIQVAFGYVGARTLTQFQKRATFIQITEASRKESAPHSILSS